MNNSRGNNTPNRNLQQEISVDLFLAQGQYLRVHRNLIRRLGYRDAFVLTMLIDKRQYWRQKGGLDENGGFYKTREEIAEEAGTGIRDMDSALKALHQLGAVSSKLHGLPAKKHYYIHDQVVLSLMQDSKPPPPSSAKEQNLTCSKSRTVRAPKAEQGVLQKHSAYTLVTENTKLRTQDLNKMVIPPSVPPPRAELEREESPPVDGDWCADAPPPFCPELIESDDVPLPLTAPDTSVLPVAVQGALQHELPLANAWEGYMARGGGKRTKPGEILRAIVRLRKKHALNEWDMHKVFYCLTHHRFWSKVAPISPLRIDKLKPGKDVPILMQILKLCETDQELRLEFLRRQLDVEFPDSVVPF